VEAGHSVTRLGCRQLDTMPADGHAIPFIALQDGKFNVTDEAAEFLKSVSTDRMPGQAVFSRAPLSCTASAHISLANLVLWVFVAF